MSFPFAVMVFEIYRTFGVVVHALILLIEVMTSISSVYVMMIIYIQTILIGRDNLHLPKD